jgi:SNF2-related domain/Helicase conserved C-terminal domain/Restriction endonuclease
MSDELPAWKIAEPADGVLVLVEPDGVWFRGRGLELSDQGKWRFGTPKTRLGRLLPTLIPQLFELELATAEPAAIHINHANFASLETRGVDAFDGVVPWAPFTIELESSGSLGRDDFKYSRRFYLGTQVVHLERLGCLVRRGDTIYRLDSQTYALVETIDAFNAMPPEAKAAPDAFIRFADIKGLAEGVGAQLDQFITDQRVLVPSRVGLDLIVEGDGRITFAPKIEGVPDEAMRRAFLAADDIEEVYALEQPGGGRIRVVLDNVRREVLRRMQRVRHLGGVDRAKVLRDPHAVFDGVADAIDIDPAVFGPRVKGIGDFPFVAQPYLRRSGTGVFEDREAGERAQRANFEAGIKCSHVDGRDEDLAFGSREELLYFWREAHEARRSGVGTVDFHGSSILVDEPFIRTLDELIERVTPPKPRPKGEPPSLRRFLLIYTNENEVEYDEPSPAERRDVEKALTLPRSLKKDIALKDHQRDGIAWLQRNFLLRRHGCLLADDMGMGKTLQVLAFLAWLIERGEICPGSENPEVPPWDPILVVAPLILLDSETWLNDARTFFEAEGANFQPWLVLHGPAIERLKRPGATGQETAVGEPVLDVEKLRQFRLVLTNYETIVNYQFSFAQLKAHWSVVVTDEAQEFKVPSTKRSHALKALAPRFRIACTGTPVETRLLDVWNIFDFLQPGHLLASAAEFTKVYERPAEERTDDGGLDLTDLKERLRFGRDDAFVIRREKTSLNGLPEKHEYELRCDLSPEQRQWHVDVLQRARAGGTENHPFTLIDILMKVYQHPALVPHYDPVPLTEAVDRCPKLGALLDCLDKIRAVGEKALIFTRSLGTQQLLANALRDRFGIDVVPVNGATPRRGTTRVTKVTRASILRGFRESRGFNVSILSPDVAGIGLTLTEANHVIHYGRWWNPATESQATDRAYRIGQTRDVHVYYPIATDPQREFETFDEKLHALLCRRRRLAAEFLAPMPSDEDLQREFMSDVFGATGPSRSSDAHPLSKDDVRRLGFDRFEALVALLDEKRGARVILTPLSGDDGIDVIAIREREIRLIQCKHTLWGASVDADVIAEVINAFDGYRARRLRASSSRVTLRPVLVTNGNLTRSTRREAKARDIQLADGPDLWTLLNATPCTAAEVEAMTARRLATMRDVQAAIDLLARTAL